MSIPLSRRPPKLQLLPSFPLAAAGRAAWLIFLALYVAALAPFYAWGLHLIPKVALQYAGEGKYGVPYAPQFSEVYGSGLIAVLASVLIDFGPLITFAVIVGLALVLIRRWGRYSLNQIFSCAALTLLSLAVLALGWNIWGDFFFWGVG